MKAQQFKYFLLFLLLIICQTAYAEDALPPGRTITAAQWQQVTSDSAFSYRNEVEAMAAPPPSPGLFAKFMEALAAFLSSGIGYILLWGLFIALILFAIFKIVKSTRTGLFGRKQRTLGLQQTGEENIITDWDAALQQALACNDNRLAIRYSYMLLLEILQRRGLLEYRADKTNYEYARELKDAGYRQSFKQLSRQYEYSWYGRYTLQPADYTEYMSTFNSIKNKLGH